MQSSGARAWRVAFCSRWQSMHQPIVSGGGAARNPATLRRSLVSVGPVRADTVVIVSTAP